MAPARETDRDVDGVPQKYTPSGKKAEHTELPPSLQRMVAQAEEDDSVYEEYWAGEYGLPI